MTSSLVLSLALLFVSGNADNVDNVQVAMSSAQNAASELPSGMACNNPVSGFVRNGVNVTGMLKTCPVESPFLKQEAHCAGIECKVNPDRTACCRGLMCECPNGVATISWQDGGSGITLCNEDMEVDCSSCNDGYYISAPAGLGAQTCEPNVCECPNGVASVFNGSGDTLCVNNGDHDCSACNAGYHTTQPPTQGGLSTCEPNVCTCPNGVKTTAGGNGPTLCGENGAEDCSDCNDGYMLQAPAGPGAQACRANTCLNGLPTGNVKTTACQGTTTNQTCRVGCPDGYAGDSTAYVCTVNGTFVGSPPTCTEITCDSQASTTLITDNVVTDCTTISAGETCTFHCATGYEGPSNTYTCNASGWTGETPMNCVPGSCDATNPENGVAGDCTDALPSGETCNIQCNEGYMVQGQTSCDTGVVTYATCVVSHCDITPPVNGKYGNCTGNLASGDSCTPACNTGFTLNGTTGCLKGNVTQAVCHPDLKCELVYEKGCSDTTGYWSNLPDHLTYKGCEYFCNIMNTETNGGIKGCELGHVMSAIRATKGKRCFAHSKTCVLDNHNDNAAAVCTKYGAEQAQQADDAGRSSLAAIEPTESIATKKHTKHHH